MTVRGYNTLQRLFFNCRQKRFWAETRNPETASRAFRIALIVGTILLLINQGDVLIAGSLPPLWKILLTYCVPYCVSTYSAASFAVMAKG